MTAAEHSARRVSAVVLCGGASRRFGSDKLATPVDGVPLLERAIADLPTDWTVILVGPDRAVPGTVTTGRTIRTVREQPVGGGPAAGLVAGIAAALADGAEIVVTLPGDAPRGGAAATKLVAALNDGADAPTDAMVDALVGVDLDGVEQPLQIAATATAAARLAAVTDAAGRPARSLLPRLGPYRRLTLAADLTADIDVPDDLAHFRPSPA